MSRVAVLTVLLAASAFAAPPQKFLEQQIELVRTLIGTKVVDGTPQAAELDQKLMAVVDPVMEFDKLAEAALKKHWPTLKPEQKAEFVKLFRELVFRSYLKRVRGANDAYKLIDWNQKPRGRKGALVEVVADTGQVQIELAFNLKTKDGNTWVAEDVIIDEVSLVQNYREQFNKIIAKDGWDGLIKKMRKKVGEMGPPTPTAAAPSAPPKK